MSSPFTSLSRTAIPTIFFEVLLSTSLPQLPQALAAILFKHIIIMPFFSVSPLLLPRQQLLLCPCIHCSFASLCVVQLLALESLNCHLVLHFQLGIGRPCGTVFAPLCGASLHALGSSLLPPGATLLYKTSVLLFITVLRSLSILISH